MPAEMYRAPVAEAHKVGTVLIQDNKELRKAEPVAGVYSFTEAGAGVQPLVLIGDQNGVVNFFATNPGLQIVSRIADLQEIYMSVKRYTPAQRYEALNPVGDGIVAVTQGAASFAPGNMGTDVGGVLGELISLGKKFFGEKKKEKKKSSAAPLKLCVTFHYLPGYGMQQVATGSITFQDLYRLVSIEIWEMNGGRAGAAQRALGH